MSTSDKLNRILQSKSDIKDAIIEKGGVVNDSTPLKDYAQAIRGLPSGGASPHVRDKVIGAYSSIDYFVKKSYAVTPILASHTEDNYPLSNINDGDNHTFWSCGSRQTQGEWVIFDIDTPLQNNSSVSLSTCFYNQWGEYPNKVQTFIIPKSDVDAISAGTLDFFSSNYLIIDEYNQSSYTGEAFVNGKFPKNVIGQYKAYFETEQLCIGLLLFCNSGSPKISECNGILREENNPEPMYKNVSFVTLDFSQPDSLPDWASRMADGEQWEFRQEGSYPAGLYSGSSSYHVGSGKSSGYIEIPEDIRNEAISIGVLAQVSSESNWDFLKMGLDNTITYPADDRDADFNNKIFNKISGETSVSVIKECNKEKYILAQYWKDSGGNSGIDRAILKRITFNRKELVPYVD